MFKTIKAFWKVLRNKDINASKKDIEKHLALLEKEKKEATENGEPWVAIVNLDVDFNNLSNGSIELDWNDKFIANLIRFGYQGKTDADLVDQWFTDVCRNIVLETYEQSAADLHPVKSRDIGNGKREYE